jgi:predicted nucleotidyltransferase component of viral defense system
MKLITREKLEYISKKILQYPLHDAEKDYFLALVMRIVSKSSLNNKLVFKGGTSIYHCYLDQLRFSEDLDFTAIDKNLAMNDIEKIFNPYEPLSIKKKYTSNATLKIERLKYGGILKTPNSIKLEVDKLQNVYLKPLRREYKNVWGLSFSVNVMNPIEICAEKIRACNDRFRYRDFYDLYMLTQRLEINLTKSIDIISKKEIRKKINKENIKNHLHYALEEISQNADNIYYKEEISEEKLTSFFQSLDIPSFEPNV